MKAKSNRITRIVNAAMLAAVVFVMTWIASPLPIGNINLGDCAILVGSFILGGPLGVLACGIGAALADLTAGYVIYAPATLIIKMLMSLCVILFKKVAARLGSTLSCLIGALLAELLMVALYFLYEGLFLYGFAASLMSIPFNLIQGGVAILVALPLSRLLSKAINGIPKEK